ncbi:hypothetical protein GWK47_053386 [Chionoecetes opilio]|uniref:Uncharacterized protein n=1 Tax=Chionoecetes opilio TaxID=41210 RepID=A0A8J4XZK8_CHIOP|nr:hypothetical protein GWK47_053386 [Chionoecetes opilio]
MAPHHEVAAARAPRAGLADKDKTRQTESGGNAGGAQHAVIWCKVGRQCIGFQDMPLLRPEGHFWRLCSAPPPRARSSAHPSFDLTPTSVRVIRWRVGDSGVAARGDQLAHALTRHVSLPAVATLGRKCLVRVAICLGTSAYPNVSSGYTHDSHPRFARGQHATPWETITCRSPWGLSPRYRVHLHRRRRAATYLSLKACQGPSPGPSHLPAPPFTHQLCWCCGATRHPQDHVARNRHLITNLYRSTVDRLEMVLGALRAHCVLHGTTPLQRLSVRLTTSTYGPTHPPTQSTSSHQSPLHFF